MGADPVAPAMRGAEAHVGLTTPSLLPARSHLAKRLKSEGHYIVACDWKRNEHMPVSQCGAAMSIVWW